MAAYNLGAQNQNTIQSTDDSPQLVNITILYHSDLHSQLVPWPVADYNSSTGLGGIGGMARIATEIESIRSTTTDPVLTFMDGDFLMGTPFSWLGAVTPTYAGEASPEIVLMSPGVLNYNAVGLGNHEFDYSDEGLSLILNNTNTTLGGVMPLMLCSNLVGYPNPSSDYYDLGAFIQKNATITTSNGVKIGLFSVIGYNAFSSMFFMGHYTIADPIVTAQQEVAYLKSQNVSLIICLSHSGYVEDEALAAKVPGIDLILSAHDHIMLPTPININTPTGNTTIVDSGAYGMYLGDLNITVNNNTNPGQGITVRNWYPIPINDTIPEFLPVQDIIENAPTSYGTALNAVLAGFGLPPYNTTIAYSSTGVPTYGEPFSPAPYSIVSGETPIGDLVADADRWMVSTTLGSYVDFAFLPSGVIRNEFAPGYISLYDAISVVPLGGVPYSGPYYGWLMTSFYLNGSEVKNAMEFTLYEGGDYFEQVSGLKLTYDPALAPPGNLLSIEQVFSNGTSAPINDNQLYRVCVNLEAALIIPQVGTIVPSLAISPRYSNGTVINTSNPAFYVSQILVGTGIPEWLSLVQYLANQSGVVSTAYNSTQGRITVGSINYTPALSLVLSWQLAINSQTSSNTMVAGILVVVFVIFAVGVAVAARRP
jgi:2',3'-cyclic-nucleotide 2'-phosphodiesterase (5'-nucleotidase family)